MANDQQIPPNGPMGAGMGPRDGSGPLGQQGQCQNPNINQSGMNQGGAMNQDGEMGANPQQEDNADSFFQQMMNMGSNDQFLKGLLIGAGVTYLMSNEKVQQKMVKTVVQGWSMMQGGMEEMKERFRDAEAEIQAEQEFPES